MKYLSEFREAKRQQALVKQLAACCTKPWSIMEICGGQTHAIAKYGLLDLLPKNIELIHGPGCPVCVTPMAILNHAIALAQLPNIILCSFGDMLRVPGSEQDLISAKARGGDVRMVYSPLDAITIAKENPTKEVVFFAVGFETTAPAHAMSILQAQHLKLKNFSVLCSLVLVPPAIEFLLQSPNNRIQGFLAAGHVCSVMGFNAYHSIAKHDQVPIIITGFEPVDILQGILHCVKQLESGQHTVENQYSRCVSPQGNILAQQAMSEVFETIDYPWRGIGTIPQSGLGIQEAFRQYDANFKFPLKLKAHTENKQCISGLILQGQKKPKECPAFGRQCTPETPLGAPMVSTEGACAAYYTHNK